MSNGSILEELKRMYREGSVLMRLIYVNVAIFLAVQILTLVFFLFKVEPQIVERFILDWFASTADLSSLIRRPWSIVSYMFLHTGLWHILFNMIVFYFAGVIFLQYLGEKRMTALYFLGGLGGLLLFILTYNIFPRFEDAISSNILGASAAVMAIFIGIATYRPNFEVQLLFIPIPIRLKWIAGLYVLIDFLSIQGQNSGGHIAHIGGAIVGFWTISRIKRGNSDILMRFYRFLTDIPDALGLGKKPKMKVKHRSRKAGTGTERARYMTDEQYNATKQAEQEEIDKILDKISKSGYESLTKKEKEILFRASKDK
jgi:membrane associated rhomboid family serine protease